MARRKNALALTVALVMNGCYESDFPLDSTAKVSVDRALIGTWRCLPFDGDGQEPPATVVVESARDRLYAIDWREQGKDPERYQAYASTVRVPRLLNIQVLKDGVASTAWIFGRYAFLRPDVVQLQIVRDKALERVEKTPTAIRKAIEGLQDSVSLYEDFCVCVRAREEK